MNHTIYGVQKAVKLQRGKSHLFDNHLRKHIYVGHNPKIEKMVVQKYMDIGLISNDNCVKIFPENH